MQLQRMKKSQTILKKIDMSARARLTSFHALLD